MGCLVCGKRFLIKKDLIEHYAYVHPGLSRDWLLTTPGEKMLALARDLEVIHNIAFISLMVVAFIIALYVGNSR